MSAPVTRGPPAAPRARTPRRPAVPAPGLSGGRGTSRAPDRRSRRAGSASSLRSRPVFRREPAGLETDSEVGAVRFPPRPHLSGCRGRRSKTVWPPGASVSWAERSVCLPLKCRSRFTLFGRLFGASSNTTPSEFSSDYDRIITRVRELMVSAGQGDSGSGLMRLATARHLNGRAALGPVTTPILRSQNSVRFRQQMDGPCSGRSATRWDSPVPGALHPSPRRAAPPRRAG